MINSRKNKLIANTFSSLLYQITTIICGFILPRLILQAFGSEVNGLVNSITQFLNIIAFLELGVGAVVQSSLYKPLAESDNEQISKVIVSANRFFRTIAKILLIYVVLLVIFYPYFANQNFSYAYTATLIIAISISLFAQYYFGIVNRLLITADQRGYIQYFTLTIAVILNTVVCSILIKLGVSIQVVKLTTSMIYLMQPFIVYLYVRRNYNTNYKVKYAEEPIKQKWNGIAQHVAAVVLDNTDIVVLTTFSTLSNVSIYSVYFLVVKGIKQLFLSMTNGIQSLIGELLARKDYKELNKTFAWTEWIIHTGTVFTFTVTSIVIVPFVKVYTRGINDANYIRPVFALLLVFANASHCLRLPYNIMILAAGHYKQTQNNYIIAAALNIIISIAAVHYLGLVGVAIGTLVAMLYQTIWMAIYNSKHIIRWPIQSFVKQLSIDLLSVFMIFACTHCLKMSSINYAAWVTYSLGISAISATVICIINLIFYKQKMLTLAKKLKLNYFDRVMGK